MLPALVAGLDDAAWRARPQPSEWSALEIVCHLRDEETLDFGARLRVIVENGEAFEPIDPERLAGTARYREADPSAVLAAFIDRRRASLGGDSRASLGRSLAPLDVGYAGPIPTRDPGPASATSGPTPRARTAGTRDRCRRDTVTGSR